MEMENEVFHLSTKTLKILILNYKRIENPDFTLWEQTQLGKIYAKEWIFLIISSVDKIQEKIFFDYI